MDMMTPEAVPGKPIAAYTHATEVWTGAPEPHQGDVARDPPKPRAPHKLMGARKTPGHLCGRWECDWEGLYKLLLPSIELDAMDFEGLDRSPTRDTNRAWVGVWILTYIARCDDGVVLPGAIFQKQLARLVAERELKRISHRERGPTGRLRWKWGRPRDLARHREDMEKYFALAHQPSKWGDPKNGAIRWIHREVLRLKRIGLLRGDDVSGYALGRRFGDVYAVRHHPDDGGALTRRGMIQRFVFDREFARELRRAKRLLKANEPAKTVRQKAQPCTPGGELGAKKPNRVPKTDLISSSLRSVETEHPTEIRPSVKANRRSATAPRSDGSRASPGSLPDRGHDAPPRGSLRSPGSASVPVVSDSVRPAVPPDVVGKVAAGDRGECPADLRSARNTAGDGASTSPASHPTSTTGARKAMPPSSAAPSPPGPSRAAQTPSRGSPEIPDDWVNNGVYVEDFGSTLLRKFLLLRGFKPKTGIVESAAENSRSKISPPRMTNIGGRDG